MSKIKINELRASQKQLCDSFVTDVETIGAVMAQYRNWNEKLEENGFHHYTLRNLILANGQLRKRSDTNIELLAPYRRWQKINRNVRKGEKALWILAPIQKKIKEAKNDGETDEYVTWFKKVPVFDLSQTDGEQVFEDFVSGEPLVSWETIKTKSQLEIVLTNSTYLEGKTDGEKIWVSKNYGDDKKTCIYLHERAHSILHFDEDGKETETKWKELEAESVAYITASAIGINNESSASYIQSYVKDNPIGEIEIRGNTIINCAVKILSELGINIQ